MSEETFRWIVAIGIVVSTVCVIAMASVVLLLLVLAKKAQQKTKAIMVRTEPIIGSVRGIMEDLKPKIARVSTDAEDIVKITKQQVERVGELIKDFSDRAKVQVARIDGAVDETVDQVQTARTAATEALMKPVREVDGFFSGVRAAMNVYLRPRKSSVDHATQDEEMFI